MVPKLVDKIEFKGVREVNFFDRTNGLAARTIKRIAAKQLVLSKSFVSQTPIEIKF